MSIVKNSNGVQSSDGAKILWIGFPPCFQIHEQRLYNALILFGEIEWIRIFPTTHHALVGFRSAEEARRTKDGIQGRLFDDPRIQVLYSNGQNGPVAADHKVNSSVMPPSLPRGGPSPSGSGSQFGSVQGSGPVRTIGSTFPPQRNQHGTETLTRVSLPTPAPTFQKFPDRVNRNSFGPGNWSKSPPVIDPTNPQRPNLHGTETLRSVSLPAPAPPFQKISGPVNINKTGPGNWSKSPPVFASTKPPQRNLHGTETLRNVSLPTPAPPFHQFVGPANIDSSGPGNWSKSPPVSASTKPPQANLHGTETLRNVALPTPAPTFHQFTGPVNINSSGPGNWSKSPPVIVSTNPPQTNLHRTETLKNVGFPTPAPMSHPDPVNINSSGPGNWSKPPQVIGSTTPSQANLHGTETLRNVPLPTSAFTFQKSSDPVNIKSSGPGNWSKLPPDRHPIPNNAWDANVAARESKRARIDKGLQITGASGSSTSMPAEMGSGPMANNIGPPSYGEVSQQVNTGSDNQNMGETANTGSHINGSHDQFPVGLGHTLPPTFFVRTNQEECYGGVEGSCCWQGTIAKSGIPICNALCILAGKSIEDKFPEVINCSAKTDLHMLTKHFYQACDFALYYFMPERDQDAEPYQEFLEYLSSKNRACVAQFSEGTTMFLVPPSDFSEHVLKAPDRNHIFGLVLKFLQQQGSAMQQTTMLSQSPQQLHDKRQQFLFSTQMPTNEDPTQFATDNMSRSLSTLNGMHTEQIASPEMTNQIPGTQPAAISLTPELLNTLFNHVSGLRTGNELPRHGHESLEMETDKSRSYQATLQLAANLIRELKQKEQQQI